MYLEKGDHELMFRYSTPYMRTGILCSGIGLLLMLAAILFTEMKIKKKHGRSDLTRQAA